MFLKLNVLRNFANFTRKHLCWSLFLIKLQVKLLKTLSFTEHIQWLLLCFFTSKQLNIQCYNVNFGLYYNQKLSWKYCNFLHQNNFLIIFYIKIIFLHQNNLIFSVTTLTLGYITTKNWHGNTSSGCFCGFFTSKQLNIQCYNVNFGL